MPAQVKATQADVYRWNNPLAACQAAARGKRGRAATAAFERSSTPFILLKRIKTFSEFV